MLTPDTLPAELLGSAFATPEDAAGSQLPYAWAGLLHGADRELRLIDPSYRVQRYLIRYGLLHLDIVNAGWPHEKWMRAYHLAGALARESAGVCAECGAPGRLRIRGDDGEQRYVACAEHLLPGTLLTRS